MAIAFRAANTAVVGTGTSPTAVEPSGTTSGDVILATFIVDSPGGTPGIPSGWTSVWSGASSGTHFRYNICYVVRGGSAPSLVFTLTGSQYRELRLFTYSGVDGTTPIDSQSTVASVGSTSILPDPPATTAVSSSAMALVWMDFWGGAPVGGWTAPAGYTMRGTTDAAAYGMAEKQLSASGSEDPAKFGGTPAGTDDGVAMVLTLKPSAGGGGGATVKTLAQLGVG